MMNRNRMAAPRRLAAAVGAMLVLGACGSDEPDAYGNFEAEEVLVSAEGTGRLLAYNAREGQRLGAGEAVGTIDTAQLALQRRDLLARRDAARSRRTEVTGQIEVLEAQREVAEREYERTKRLVAAQAATAQQLDRAERDVRTLRQQIEAMRTSVGTAGQEIESIDAQIALVEDRIRKSTIRNPAAGTVLASFVEPGEFVQPGQPLYKVAALDTLVLRAYVSGTQLSGIKLGQPVQVRIDRAGGGFDTRRGTVTWIASEAEFTPTPIQTREERTDQVYAVKVRVANADGALKIGMPAELSFAEP